MFAPRPTLPPPFDASPLVPLMKDWSVCLAAIESGLSAWCGANSSSFSFLYLFSSVSVCCFFVCSFLFFFLPSSLSLSLCASWHENPDVRPGFEKILERLSKLREEASDDDNPITGAPSAS